MTNDAEGCRFLEWDSKFFRLRIASFVSAPTDRAAFERAVAWCRKERIDCVYLLTDIGDLQTRRLAEDHAFRLVDVRVTYQLRVSPSSARAAPSSGHPVPPVRLARPEDVPELRALAASSHVQTRFWSDERFPRADCAELYATWIEKSVLGGAQAVWVGDHEGRVAGYFTCIRKDEDEGEVGLVAVSPAARGLGLGRALTDRALDWFREQDCSRVSVATQGSSVAGRHLYESAGFRSSSLQFWHHGWLDSGRARA